MISPQAQAALLCCCQHATAATRSCAVVRAQLCSPSQGPTLHEEDNPSERVRVRWKSAAFLRRRHRPHTCSAMRCDHGGDVSVMHMVNAGHTYHLSQHEHMQQHHPQCSMMQ